MRSARWFAMVSTGFCSNRPSRSGTAMSRRGHITDSRGYPRSYGAPTRRSSRRSWPTRCCDSYGILRSQGDIVVILDADDELVPEWPEVLRSVADEWPREAQICFSACRTPSGRSTVSDPEYRGFLTESDLLNERHRGEYLPLFRGSYIRSRRYVDLGTRRSCGILSYLTFSQEAPFCVTPRVLRIYHDDSDGSVSSGWATPPKAREAVRCYGALLEHFADAYRQRAPRVYRTKLLKLAIYRHLAGEPNAWAAWRAGATQRALPETVAAAMLLLLSPGWCSRVVGGARRTGLIRRYG